MSYKFIRFEKSTRKNKKYMAVLVRLGDNKIKYVHFGDKNFQHFKDKTGLGLYTNLNHYDLKRRESYRARHSAKGNHLIKYTPAYYSYNYLW
jgi:hypothetical protein